MTVREREAEAPLYEEEEVPQKGSKPSLRPSEEVVSPAGSEAQEDLTVLAGKRSGGGKVRGSSLSRWQLVGDQEVGAPKLRPEATVVGRGDGRTTAQKAPSASLDPELAPAQNGDKPRVLPASVILSEPVMKSEPSPTKPPKDGAARKYYPFAKNAGTFLHLAIQRALLGDKTDPMPGFIEHLDACQTGLGGTFKTKAEACAAQVTDDMREKAGESGEDVVVWGSEMNIRGSRTQKEAIEAVIRDEEVNQLVQKLGFADFRALATKAVVDPSFELVLPGERRMSLAEITQDLRGNTHRDTWEKLDAEGRLLTGLGHLLTHHYFDFWQFSGNGWGKVTQAVPASIGSANTRLDVVALRAPGGTKAADFLAAHQDAIYGPFLLNWPNQPLENRQAQSQLAQLIGSGQISPAVFEIKCDFGASDLPREELEQRHIDDIRLEAFALQQWMTGASRWLTPDRGNGHGSDSNGHEGQISMTRCPHLAGARCAQRFWDNFHVVYIPWDIVDPRFVHKPPLYGLRSRQWVEASETHPRVYPLDPQKVAQLAATTPELFLRRLQRQQDGNGRGGK